MDTTWEKTELGELIYERHTPFSSRLIIGCLLSPFPILFGYCFFDGLIENINTTSSAEWPVPLSSLLLVLILFLLSVIPSWAVLLGRSKVIIDPLHGSVLDMFDLFICRRTKSYRIDQVSEIVVFRKAFRTSGHSSASYVIEMQLSNGKRITVAYEDIIEDAKKVAEEVAGNFKKVTVSIR